jgi:hypothetical protein
MLGGCCTVGCEPVAVGVYSVCFVGRLTPSLVLVRVTTRVQ